MPLLSLVFGDDQRQERTVRNAVPVQDDTQAVVAWAMALPPLYRDAIDRRARQESGYKGAITWGEVGPLLRGMEVMEEQQRRSGPNAAMQSPIYGYLRAVVRHARAAYQIAQSIAPHAQDLIGASDAEVRTQAEAIAQLELTAMPSPVVIVDGQEMTTAEADAAGLEWDYHPDLQRRLDPAWWTTRIRSEITEACLLLSAHLGIVGHGRALYVDDHILGRHRDRQAANAAMAAATVMRSGDDEVLLADIIKASQDAALARVYAQCLGMQHLGEEAGLVPVFLTITLPGEWHANPKAKRRKGKWNGKSARAARAQLVKDWQTYMRRLRGKVIVFGLRVIEPHQDGTPHLHAMVWVAPDDLPNVYRTLRRTFGAAPRAKAVRISAKHKNAAKPSSYLLKYILKTMTATDDEDADAKEAHKAWASAVKARRWELIGCASGIQRTWQTVYDWRKLPQEARASEAMRTALEAMRAADAARAAQDDSAPHWAAAMRALIGAEALDGGGRAVRAVRNTYAEAQNKYGETVKRPDGITDGRATIRKERQWTMVRLTADEIAQRQQAQCPATQGSKSPDVGLADSYPRVAAPPPPTAPPGAAPPPSDPVTEYIRLAGDHQHLPQWQAWIAKKRQEQPLAEAA